MTPRPAAFAIPGDIETLSGGYIYERRLLEGLRAARREVAHIRLGGSFPDPTPADMDDAARQLAGLAPDAPLILDGLVFGSMDPEVLARVPAPVVAMVHHPLALESGLDAGRRVHLFATERANLKLVAHVLVPSRHTAQILASEYGVAPERITIARPGTDRPARGGEPATSSTPLILSVGILHPRKGHDILLHALARLRHREWRAVIVGPAHDAGHAADLARLHEGFGLSGRVRLAGQVAGDELARLYRDAAIFALATRYEGYGIVFDEAMAHGLPIVTCRTGAVPDTVAKGAGLLVPPEDADAFTAALDRVLTGPDLRAKLARASAGAGAALPGWDATARTAGEVLDRVRV